jgi:hypothetical protein
MDETQMRPAGFRLGQDEGDDRIERTPLRIPFGIAASPAVAEIAVGLSGENLAGNIVFTRIRPLEGEAIADFRAHVVRHQPAREDLWNRERPPHLLRRFVELAFDDDGSLGGNIVVH